MPTDSKVFVKNVGTYVNPKSIWVKDGGIWKEVRKVWVKNGGVWSPVAPTPGSISFNSSGSFTVPTGVHNIYVSAIAGGGSAGNVVDGGRNDDYGGSGGGSGGQKTSNYRITVTPGETITVTIGGGGSRAYGGRDSGNQGGQGGYTYIYASSGTYYLIGGTGGYGGVGGDGSRYPGGTTTGSNPTISSITVDNGQDAQGGVGGYGGAGYSGNRTAGGTYGGGNQIHNELNGIDYGGGGAGAWSWYVREDNGNSPCWGGLGTSGYAYFSWGS